MQKITVTVNGASHTRDVEPRMLLVDFIRDSLSLTGTNIGCDTSQCGACTIHLDGMAVKSCTMLAVQADGSKVSTIESMGTPGNLHPIQQAFVECHGLQCGYCTPGMIMSTAALLAEHPDPTDAQIEHALEGNLCRCTGYVNIVASVRQAAAAINKTR